MLPVQWTYLALAVALISVTVVGARGPPGWEEAGFGTASLFQYPTKEDHFLSLRFAGTATDASTREAWGLLLNLTGMATRTFSEDLDGALAADENGELEAIVAFVDPESRAVVDSFVTRVAYHATRADGIVQAMDAWQFQVRAPEGQGPFWFAVWGEVTGLQVQDGQALYLSAADGQAQVQDLDGHRATQYHLDLTGQATDQRMD